MSSWKWCGMIFAQKNTEIDMKTIVYEHRPNDFDSKFETAATYVNFNGKVLLLQNAPHKREGGCWGVPAGKLEPDEAPIKGARRELFEETGIDVGIEHFSSLGTLYIRLHDLDFIYHRFIVNLNDQPAVVLSAEHVSYKWVLRSEAENLPLMQGAQQALDAYYRYTS